MNGKVLNFELSSKDLKIKELIKNDFLELKVRAISDANPNRNNSHFTVEAMKDALPSFVNKPILGSFNTSKNDFRGHNDNGLHYDAEMESMYFDYNSNDSERILGMIRESDPIEITYDSQSKETWLSFTAALWTSYSYKAVKSLLKSREGNSSVSVEVEVIDSYEDEQGVEQITKFNFLGCTILGADVAPGIAGANLSVRDFEANENYSQKQKCLRFAYQALDEYNNNVESPEEIRDSYIKKEPAIDNENTDEIAMQEETKEGGNDKPMKLSNEQVEEPVVVEEDFAKCADSTEGDKPDDSKETEACGKCAAEDPNKEDEACGKCAEDPNKEEEACGKCAAKEDEACGKCAKEEEACGSKEEEACGKCAEDPNKEDEACGKCAEEDPNKEEEACGKCAKCSKFAQTVDLDGETVDINQLLEKYQLLNDKFTELDNAAKADRANKLVEFGKSIINEDADVDSDARENFISQVTEKCSNFELSDEDSVKQFAVSLLAMYYYTAKVSKKKEEDFSINIEVENKTQVKKASKVSELNEAIKKLNYLN